MRKIDGFDSALVGMATVWQREEGGGARRIDTLIYDGDVIVTILMHQSGLSQDEAEEYISYNIENAYIGETTPIIVWPCSMDRVEDILEAEDGLRGIDDE
jgi:hypothetical protein